MKKTLVTTAVLASFAVLMMATAQGDPLEKEITQLRASVANLGLRVDQLEHAAGHAPASAPNTPVSTDPVRTMVLVSINETNHTGDHAEEIARLERETESLMNTVNSAADQAASDAGQQIYVAHARGGVRGWGGAVGGGYATSNAGAVRRQVMADHQVENRYATMHATKQQRLKALKQADSEPRQIIMGHDGNIIISLEGKHNLQSKLDDISIGDTVTWTGNRVSADDGSESWEISTINKVE